MTFHVMVRKTSFKSTPQAKPSKMHCILISFIKLQPFEMITISMISSLCLSKINWSSLCLAMTGGNLVSIHELISPVIAGVFWKWFSWVVDFVSVAVVTKRFVVCFPNAVGILIQPYKVWHSSPGPQLHLRPRFSP